jgi:hypothetical protein
MSFPSSSYLNSASAISEFVNKARENGLVTSASVDAYALVFATLANIFDNVPTSTTLTRSATMSEAGDIPANVNHVELSNETEDNYVITLVAPLAGEYGLLKVIAFGANDADDVTLDVTDVINVPEGHTLATFEDEGNLLVLLGTSAGWLYIASSGVDLSTPE